MFKATINKEEDSYRVLSTKNKSYFKGTSKECDEFLTKPIVIPMYGGYDYALHLVDNGEVIVYFITNEGISSHPSESHMYHCLEHQGFRGYLDIKSKAIPIAKYLLTIPNLPSYFTEYLRHKLINFNN